MIQPQTIAAIVDAARIDEVVGDFVSLKKRGVNYIGLCPFHNEKTPSFNVNPARNIFKCFGCGKGGSAVSFIMEHEHYTYPEALRYLAKKYNIEIEEKEMTPEMQQEEGERESQYIVSAFAEQFFVDSLHNTEEGKSIGISYFKERGFSEMTIQKFRLGYSLDSWDALTNAATGKGYKIEFLEKTGLTKSKDGKHYDGYRGRVMFPIHNLSGRVIGFGGRVLKKDEKTAKYINTPECEIFHKSKTLYGIYFARKSIIEKNNCYLVEGYTDVISLHQSGIENTVASSGTSLTQDQIRLIARYTKNITILYDGDAAGLKASFRGIDMILEEGMNVKAVLFPDGEDPDSFSKKVSSSELEKFIALNSKDFLVFKTSLLKNETEGDPIKKTLMIHEIVASIALIPDNIARDVYIKECSKLMNISEPALISELNKHRRKKFTRLNQVDDESPEVFTEEKQRTGQSLPEQNLFYQEKDIIRLLLNYGDLKISVETIGEDKKPVQVETLISDYIIHELFEKDNLRFETPLMKEMFDEYLSAYQDEKVLPARYFIEHSNEKIRNLSTDLLTFKYELHNWEGKNIIVKSEENNPVRMIGTALSAYKEKKINQMIEENRKQMKLAIDAGDDYQPFLVRQKTLDDRKKELAKEPGRVIIK